MNEVIICRTCGRQWVSSDLEGKERPEKESPNCHKCNGKMNIFETNWVSWKCANCGYSSGLEYCSECRSPRDWTDPKHFGIVE